MEDDSAVRFKYKSVLLALVAKAPHMQRDHILNSRCTPITTDKLPLDDAGGAKPRSQHRQASKVLPRQGLHIKNGLSVQKRLSKSVDFDFFMLALGVPVDNILVILSQALSKLTNPLRQFS